MSSPLVSILINNYNYDRYLKQAIESALAQTYRPIEIVVVDDGSIDASKEIVASFGDAIVPILKPNGGQASAFNVGFNASNGDILCFLDSDDTFLPNKVSKVVEAFVERTRQNRKVMIFNMLEAIDEDGNLLGYRRPDLFCDFLPPNLYAMACKDAYIPHNAAPTSGLSLSRELAQQIFPLPESVNISADSFIVRAASLLGEVYGVEDLLSQYRVHGKNNWYAAEVSQRKPESREFLLAQDRFLNQKLSENQLAPVISFFDSFYARNFYLKEGSGNDLLKLGFKVLKRHPDLKTLKFFLKTLSLGLQKIMASKADKL
ncbi:Glycosyltransferase 2-like domain-containing protein [Tumidithrix helvetica PCC 7403]|uniref:glycosyltransferase n=1 Tax=Tumidithrix helvetica TaxID=3457545 RepID=UPI003C886ECC